VTGFQVGLTGFFVQCASLHNFLFLACLSFCYNRQYAKKSELGEVALDFITTSKITYRKTLFSDNKK